MDLDLPRPSVRLALLRRHGFSDLLPILAHHTRVHEQAEKFISPYNARQRSSSLPYTAPDKETLRQLIKRGGMNEFSYNAYLASLVEFCASTKGMRALPMVHPTTLHSIQLPQPAFQLQPAPAGVTMQPSKPTDTLTELHINGAEPCYIAGLRDPSQVKFIIVRPRLGNLGTPSGTQWEALFFKTHVPYVPHWVDSTLNPRYSGLF